jgi:hypothetical protein
MPEGGGDLVEIRREWWCDAGRGVCVPRDELVDRDSQLAGGKVTQVAECRVGGEPVFVVHAHFPVLSDSDFAVTRRYRGRAFRARVRA